MQLAVQGPGGGSDPAAHLAAAGVDHRQELPEHLSQSWSSVGCKRSAVGASRHAALDFLEGVNGFHQQLSRVGVWGRAHGHQGCNCPQHSPLALAMPFHQ